MSSSETAALPRAAYTIKEFCEAHGFSRAQYYRLRAQGRAPRETRFGGSLVIISQESAREWRKRHTKPAVA
jgi:predicted DNA-binding transcriptional regulator AlpA